MTLRKESLQRRILLAFGHEVGTERAAALSAQAEALLAAAGDATPAPGPAPVEDFAAVLADLAAHG